MSRSSSSNGRPERGQTEPIGALVAVLAIVFGIGLYALYLGDAVPGHSDRSPQETAIERIGEDLEADHRGVFPAHEYEPDQDGQMRAAIEPDSLPDGSNVYVAIRGYDEGELTTFAAAHFDSAGDSLADRQLPSSHPDFGPPGGPGRADGSGVATRLIAVEVTPGDVRGAILHVEVW